MKPTRRQALPSFSGVNQSIGTFLAGLEQKILHNRPPAAVIVEEHQRGEQVATNGLVVDLPNEPIERPEPPDRSGASSAISGAPALRGVPGESLGTTSRIGIG